MAFIDIYVSKSALIQSPCEAHIAHSKPVLLYCGYSWKTDHPFASSLVTEAFLLLQARPSLDNASDVCASEELAYSSSSSIYSSVVLKYSTESLS